MWSKSDLILDKKKRESKSKIKWYRWRLGIKINWIKF